MLLFFNNLRKFLKILITGEFGDGNKLQAEFGANVSTTATKNAPVSIKNRIHTAVKTPGTLQFCLGAIKSFFN